ncbi:MAG TPA: ABC transporter ATP-binding protein, partial [Candidatus Limnocylindria bacterium]
ALHGVDLSVPVGARLLLVARPEPSGSLLLRILAGLVRPARGSISLAGLARSDESALGWRRRVGCVPAQPSIYAWLSPREALVLAGKLAGLEGEERERRVDEALERFRLHPDAARPMSRSGPAVAQKTALAAALLGGPEVLLLDEPLRAVDPDERRRLLRLPGKRVTLVLASRYPASEEGLVNQVALLRDGRTALHATIEDLAGVGLPLSLRGIEELAARRTSQAHAARGAMAAAEATAR